MPAQGQPVLNRPIFVVGHPRSGTTLLASMLGRHPEIASTPESLYLTHSRYQVERRLKMGAAAVVQALGESPARHLIGSAEELTRQLNALEPLSHKAVFTALLEHYRARRHASRVLEKSPLHLRHIDELLAWYPDAKIVWIVRDGRASVASLQKVPWATHAPRPLARQWVRNMEFALAAERKAGPSMARVRYERLLSDPATELDRLQDFLEVERSDRTLDHTQPVETIKPPETGWKANVNRPLMADRAEAWRHELSPEAVATISVIMNPTLQRLGYAPEPLPPPRRRQAALEGLRSSLLYSGPAIEAMRAVRPLVMRFRPPPKPRAASASSRRET